MSGDLLGQGTIEEVASFNTWLGKQPFDHKIVIAGNNDKFIEANEREAERLLSNAVYLSDELVTINELKIFGSPWTPLFNGSSNAFSLARDSGGLAKKWAQIPDKIDILITHTPPYDIMDGKKLGCKLLHSRLAGMANGLKLHVFGHVHCGYGKLILFDGTIAVNASLCDKNDKLVNKPITVEI